MKTAKKVRVRLKKVHYHNGRKKKAGTIIRVEPSVADWLEGQEVARLLKS